MDYRKIIIYLIIIALGLGYWYKMKRDDADFQNQADTFVSVYSSLSVLAELYRNEPERYDRARDSVYLEYGYTADSMEHFRENLEGDEDLWPPIWSRIRNAGDSLIEYYKENPVEHPKPDTAAVVDSTDSL